MPPDGVFEGGVVELPVDGVVGLDDGAVVLEPWPAPIELSPLVPLEPMLDELELLAAW